MDTDSTTRGESSPPTMPGSARPVFGLAKDQGRRIEVTFALRSGGLLTVIEEMDDPLTAEMLQRYGEQLAKEIAEGGTGTRTFADGWAASGQRAWVILREVVAFSVRPAK